MSRRKLLPLICIIVILLYSLNYIYFHMVSTSGDFKMQDLTSRVGLQIDKQKDVFGERRRYLEDVCNTLYTPRGREESPLNGERIVVNLKHNLGYCNVPKIGSSFWFSVFAILEGKGLGMSNPERIVSSLIEDIPQKVHVHYFSHMSSWSKKQFLRSGQLFLFTRNPYARLLSAYVNKFLSPNSLYWNDFGKTIIAKYRDRTSEISQECGHDVSFTEFVRFVVDNPDSDPHWTPVTQMCSLCHYKYHFIGHMETFAHDTKELLRRTNLSDIVKYDTEEDSRVRLYMSSKIKQFLYHFKLIGNCISREDLIGRLWENFKFKGYIKMADIFPTETLLRNFDNITHFEQMLVETAFTRYKSMSEDEKQLNRDQFFKEMYKKVSSDMRTAIGRSFRTDFVLFGYEIDHFAM